MIVVQIWTPSTAALEYRPFECSPPHLSPPLTAQQASMTIPERETGTASLDGEASHRVRKPGICTLCNSNIDGWLRVTVSSHSGAAQ